MHDFIFWLASGILSGTVFASFFEWTLHRYLMHRPVGKFDYAFRSHALVHHHVFKADHTYHLQQEKDSPISCKPNRIRRCTGFSPSRTSGSARPMITLIA